MLRLSRSSRSRRRTQRSSASSKATCASSRRSAARSRWPPKSARSQRATSLCRSITCAIVLLSSLNKADATASQGAADQDNEGGKEVRARSANELTECTWDFISKQPIFKVRSLLIA